jgi:cytosine/adenosine deaminase-related metal-dependent hydrolase
MATSTNAELLALSGPRNPYPGKLGVVDEGALADLLLVDRNRIEDIHLLEDPARNLRVIMKDGKILKKLLGGQQKPARFVGGPVQRFRTKRATSSTWGVWRNWSTGVTPSMV